ncbi:MAG: hypothetical protein AAF696_39075 [Bacteroidota bacterium]
MHNNEQFSVSFLDVLSLGLIGLIILYTITANTKFSKLDKPNYHILALNQVTRSDNFLWDYLYIQTVSDAWMISILPTKRMACPLKQVPNTLKVKKFALSKLDEFNAAIKEGTGIELKVSNSNKDLVRSLLLDASEFQGQAEVYVGFNICNNNSVRKLAIEAVYLSADYDHPLYLEPLFLDRNQPIVAIDFSAYPVFVSRYPN